MRNQVFWLGRFRILLTVVFSVYLWRFFDPLAYSPLNHQEELTAGIWLAALGSTLFLSEGREAFGISLFLVAPFKLLDDLVYFWSVLIPVASTYGNWQFVLYDLEWSMPFYVLLVAVWLRPRGRALALLGVVASFWFFPVAMVTQGMQLFTISHLSPVAGVVLFPSPGNSAGLLPFVFGILTALLLWRLLRVPRFEIRNPGSMVDTGRHPRLQHLLESIGCATGQEVLPRVHMSGVPNMSVELDDETLGVGGDPVLFVGLPLVAVLSAGNFRSLLAHEFSHFSRGHAGVNRAIYRTLMCLSHFPNQWLPRRATAAELAGAARRLWLYGPFLLPLAVLLRKFMRPVRRHFEIVADLDSARLTGKNDMIEALRESAAAKHCYLRRNGEAAPIPSLWQAGELERFHEYWHSTKGQQEKVEILRDLESEPARPLDDYPSLGERLRALREFQGTGARLPETSNADEPAHLLFANSLASLQSEFAASTMQTAQSLGVLPEEQQEGGNGSARLKSRALRSGFWRWLEAWRHRPLHHKAADICLGVMILAAVSSVEGRLVGSMKAQQLVDSGEKIFGEPGTIQPGLTNALVEFREGRLAEGEYLLKQAANRERLEEIKESFRKAIRTYPTYARAHNDYGYALSIDGNPNDLERAINSYQQAIKLNSHYVLAYLNLGVALYRKRDPEAIRVLTEAAKLDRLSGSPQHTLGVVYGQEGDRWNEAKYFCEASHLQRRADWREDCQKASAMLELVPMPETNS